MPYDSIDHTLAERVKELTALHDTARLLQNTERPVDDLMRVIVDGLPAAWQFPDVTGARLSILGCTYATNNFRETAWMQVASFLAGLDEAGTPSGGSVEIAYLEERPEADEGPFLREERSLIVSLAEMLRMYAQHELADRAARLAHAKLEREVEARTAQLRRLATEISLVEARERREIAADLHDHLGQALAIMKLRLSELAGDAVFSGFESSISEIQVLLGQAIRYTRTLTGELSPPVLYELGLSPALDWLGEHFTKKHGLLVEVMAASDVPVLPQATQVLVWKSVRELLTNTLKHARSSRARVIAKRHGSMVWIEVSDDGVGFDPLLAERISQDPGSASFGLFTVRERVGLLGGQVEIRSAAGLGTTVVMRIPATVGEGERP